MTEASSSFGNAKAHSRPIWDPVASHEGFAAESLGICPSRSGPIRPIGTIVRSTDGRTSAPMERGRSGNFLCDRRREPRIDPLGLVDRPIVYGNLDRHLRKDLADRFERGRFSAGADQASIDQVIGLLVTTIRRIFSSGENLLRVLRRISRGSSEPRIASAHLCRSRLFARQSAHDASRRDVRSEVV